MSKALARPARTARASSIQQVQFPGTVLKLSSRPRLMVGDVVELCRGCRPANIGKIAVIERFEDGGAIVRSLGAPFETVYLNTNESAGASMTAFLLPENLYRRNFDLMKKECRHV